MAYMKCPDIGILIYDRKNSDYSTVGEKLFNSSKCEITNMTYTKVQCYPLYTALLAIGVETVDFFSLDIEGAELNILKTLPFHKINIKVFLIEVVHNPKKEELVEFMSSKGYKRIHQVAGNNFSDYSRQDYLFAKNSYNNSVLSDA